jgi:aryl-alcohol dehydrogenase-like predicted oxidoreductase
VSVEVNRRRIGTSDLIVSEISLGSWLTYSGGVAREQAQACVRAAFDAGINFIDTANVYGRGAAESLLGDVLSEYDRSSYVLATKVYFPMSDTDRGLSAEQILKQIDGSLARLRTDHVDLYQAHRYDSETSLQETMEAFSEVVRAGKARCIGISEWKAEQIEAALTIPGVERIVSSQPQYSVLWRVPEAEVIPLCRREEITQIVWSPLAQGVLTGKYLPGQPPPADSRAAREHERLHGPPALRPGPGGRSAARAHRRARGSDHAPTRAGLGAARAQRRVGDCGCQPPGAGPRQRVRVWDHARRRDADRHRRGAGRRGRPVGGPGAQVCVPRRRRAAGRSSTPVWAPYRRFAPAGTGLVGRPVCLWRIAP